MFDSNVSKCFLIHEIVDEGENTRAAINGESTPSPFDAPSTVSPTSVTNIHTN